MANISGVRVNDSFDYVDPTKYKRVCISLTEFCNWSCEYCDFTYMKHKEQAKLEKVKEYCNILKCLDGTWQFYLEGGELGLVSEEILDYVFFESNMSDKYYISTNGLFIEKGYHDKYKNKIHDILLHIDAKNFDFKKAEFKIDYPELNNYPFTYSYFILPTEDNIEYLDTIYKKYQSNDWAVCYPMPRIKDSSELNLNFISYVNEIIDNNKNVFRNIYSNRFEKTYEALQDAEYINSKRYFCANDYTKIMVDFNKGEINRCCITYTGDRIQLTEENINKIIINDFVFPFIEERCKICTSNKMFTTNYLSSKKEISRIRKIVNHLKTNGIKVVLK